MVEKRFGERPGAALINGMDIGNYCERDARTSAGGSAGKSICETNA